MRRNDVLIPGEYRSLPKMMLADPELPAGAKLVAMSIINHLGPTNDTAWPGPTLMAEETGMTRRGVQKSVEALIAAGYVIVRGKHPKNGSNMYEVVNIVRQRTACASEPSALEVAQIVPKSSAVSSRGSELSAPKQPYEATAFNHRSEGQERAPGGVPPASHLAVSGDPMSGESRGEAPILASPETTKPAGPHSVDPQTITNATSSEPSGPQVFPSPGQNRKSSDSRHSKPTKPTREQAAWFVASPANMDLYLRFGSQAAFKTRQECEASLPSTRTDWLKFKPESELHPFCDSWLFTHHMGYFWHRVCQWRAHWGIPLTFPQWERLGGEVRKASEALGSAGWDLHLHIFNCGNYFDLIRFRIGGRIGASMALTEATLGHSLVREQLLEFQRKDQQWFVAQYQAMQETSLRQQQRAENQEYTRV